MPVFARSAGTWKESIPFARNGSSWTDETDALYVRDAGSWKLIYPDPADVGDLLPVEGLAVTVGPTASAVTIGWTNPTQPTATPTDIQVRIAELGAVWTEIDVASTTFAWGALTANTEYLAQVRYIIREDGAITAKSAIRSVQFTTQTITEADTVGEPGPTDPGSPDTDTTWPIGIDIGGSPGGGDPVGTTDGCWGEYKIQILDQDTTTIDWQDTGITGTFSGALESFSYDTTSLDNTRTYRLCVREACDTDSDGTADTFGDWSCGGAFTGAFDWGATCGAIPLSPQLELSASADAVWGFPRNCQVDDGPAITDWVSGTEVAKGADFAALYATTTGEWGVVADSDGGITLTAGLAAVESTVVAGQDFTIVSRYRFSPGHTLSNGRTTTVASIGQGAIVVRLVETASTWYPTISFRLAGGYVTLTGVASAVALDSNVHTIALRWDADGDKELFLDGTEVDDDTTGSDMHASVGGIPMYWTAATGFGSTMAQLDWDRLLSDVELSEFNADIVLFTDDFDRADSASLGSEWSDGSGWAIISNKAGLTGVGGIQEERCLTTMGAADHYVQGEINASGTYYSALIARWDAVGNTGYVAYHDDSGAQYVIARKSGTTYTTIATVATAAPAQQLHRLEVEGTAIRLYMSDGAGGWTLKLSTTDATYSAGNFVGFSGFRLTGTRNMDNFEAGLGYV